MQSHPTPGACTCSATTDLPPGARHAGQVLNEAGQPTHQLVLLPQRPDKRLNWDDAKAWAASVGGDLPSPQEQALLFTNCRDALPMTWCWSNKEHEKDASFAVDCHFNNGSTKFAVKGYLNSAVAVIRIALDSFSPSGDTSAHVCTQASKPSADTSKAITALRKRLQRWELDHLRTLAAEQADRLEQAQARIEALETEVSRAWDTAEGWRMDAMELVNELQESGQNVGLTQSGALVVMHQDEAAAKEGGAA